MKKRVKSVKKVYHFKELILCIKEVNIRPNKILPVECREEHIPFILFLRFLF